MHTANLRKVAGSFMLAVPSSLLDVMHLAAGATVGVAIDNGCLLFNPNPRPRYTLDELLAQCDAFAEISPEDRKWLNAAPVSNELL